MATAVGLDSLATPPPEDASLDPLLRSTAGAADSEQVAAAANGEASGSRVLAAAETRKGKASSSKMADLATITLTSEEGDEFTLDKPAAMRSSVIRSMLDSGFEESETGTVHLQIR